jgi:hypothetical protein
MLFCWLSKWRLEPQAKVCGRPLETSKYKKMDCPLQPPEALQQMPRDF